MPWRQQNICSPNHLIQGHKNTLPDSNFTRQYVVKLIHSWSINDQRLSALSFGIDICLPGDMLPAEAKIVKYGYQK